jgi:hypothetical protein
MDDSALWGRSTIVGDICSGHCTEDPETIPSEVGHAMDVSGKTNRFILHPVDSLYPDTRWEGLATMIKTWNTYL